MLRYLASPLPQIGGEVTYNGEGFSSFIPQRTAAYVDQARACCSTPAQQHAHACRCCLHTSPAGLLHWGVLCA